MSPQTQLRNKLYEVLGDTEGFTPAEDARRGDTVTLFRTLPPDSADAGQRTWIGRVEADYRQARMGFGFQAVDEDATYRAEIHNHVELLDGDTNEASDALDDLTQQVAAAVRNTIGTPGFAWLTGAHSLIAAIEAIDPTDPWRLAGDLIGAGCAGTVVVRIGGGEIHDLT